MSIEPGAMVELGPGWSVEYLEEVTEPEGPPPPDELIAPFDPGFAYEVPSSTYVKIPEKDILPPARTGSAATGKPGFGPVVTAVAAIAVSIFIIRSLV